MEFPRVWESLKTGLYVTADVIIAYKYCLNSHTRFDITPHVRYNIIPAWQYKCQEKS